MKLWKQVRELERTKKVVTFNNQKLQSGVGARNGLISGLKERIGMLEREKHNLENTVEAKNRYIEEIQNVRVSAMTRIVEIENKRLELAREFEHYKIWAENEIAAAKRGLKMANEEIGALLLKNEPIDNPVAPEAWTVNRERGKA